MCFKANPKLKMHFAAMFLATCVMAWVCKPASAQVSESPALQNDGQLMVGGTPKYPIGLFVNIEPRWINNDPARIDALLKELSATPFNVLINSSGTIGTADEISRYHSKLAGAGLCEIVGLQNYYAADKVTNRVPNPASLFAGLPDEQAIRQTVQEIGRHPTVAGWYIFDCVPENPPLVNEHYQWVKSADEKRPVFLQCFMPTYQQDHYLSACNVLINDVFPYDKVLAQAAGFEINQPAKYRKEGLHQWAAIQGNSWFEYSVHEEVRNLVTTSGKATIDTDRTKIPSKNQMISLALLAWVQNHSGVVFAHPHSILTEAEADRRWPVIVEAARELGKLSSILVSPAVESGVTSDTSAVRCILVQSGDSRYLIAVNAGDSARTTSLSLSSAAGALEQISGDGKASLSGQQVQVQLEVWQYVVAKLN